MPPATPKDTGIVLHSGVARSGRAASWGRTAARAAVRVPLVRPFLSSLGRLGCLPAWVWRRLPAEGDLTVRLPEGQSFRYHSSYSDGIGRALLWCGWQGHAPETARVLLRLARESLYLLDIGANTGVFTLLALAANEDCRVMAFEPVPRIRELLAQNLRLNGWENRCEVREEAVSDAEGVADLHVPLGSLPTSASLNPEGFRGHDGAVIRVPVTTVDAACVGGHRVDLVKIDVEGFEDAVLAGMRRVLAEMRPRIIVECNPDGPVARVEKLLAHAGYRLAHLRGTGPAAMDHIVPDKAQRWRNYLCIPAEDDAAGILG